MLAHRERVLRDFELYADPAAFVAHMKGASMAAVNQEAGHLLLSLTGLQSRLGTEVVAGVP